MHYGQQMPHDNRCDCRQALLDAAAQLLVDADKARQDKRTRGNAAFITSRANAYGAAAGFLARTQTRGIRDDPEPEPGIEALREMSAELAT